MMAASQPLRLAPQDDAGLVVFQTSVLHCARCVFAIGCRVAWLLADELRDLVGEPCE